MPRNGINSAFNAASSAYEPLDPGTGASAAESRRFARRPRRGCTQGLIFNFVVFIAICVSGVLLFLEADLGILGFSGKGTSNEGLEADLDLVGVGDSQQKDLEKELKEGFKVDTGLKKKATEFLQQKGHVSVKVPNQRPGAYSVCEYFLVLFFLIEYCIRWCDQCGSYCKDGWLGLDTAVVVQGLLDILLPFFAAQPPSAAMSAAMAMLRVLRVLRVLRLPRVVPKLRPVAKVFMNASFAMLWVSIIILVLNFACAVCITVLVGQQAELWGAQSGQIDAWFGSVGKSMYTLCLVMTLAEWDTMASVLTGVIPSVGVSFFFVAYIMLCFFTVVSVVTGMVGDTFMTSQRREKQRERKVLEGQRLAFAGALANVFAASDSQRNGKITRDGFCSALEAHPDVVGRLHKMGIDASNEELTQLYDRLAQDSEDAPAVKIDNVVEAVTNLRGPARGAAVLELKRLLLSMRRESASQHKERQDAVAAAGDAEKQAAAELKQQVQAVQDGLAEVVKLVGSFHVEHVRCLEEIAALKEQVEIQRKRQEQKEEKERREKSEAMAGIGEKLEMVQSAITGQLAQLMEKTSALESKASFASTTATKGDEFAEVSELPQSGGGESESPVEQDSELSGVCAVQEEPPPAEAPWEANWADAEVFAKLAETALGGSPADVHDVVITPAPLGETAQAAGPGTGSIEALRMATVQASALAADADPEGNALPASNRHPPSSNCSEPERTLRFEILGEQPPATLEEKREENATQENAANVQRAEPEVEREAES